MSATASFDTLQYAKKLEKVGFTPEQAEVHAEAIKELVDNKLATKDDLRQLEERLFHYINQETSKLAHRIGEMGYKLTIRLGGMLIIGIVALSIIVKLF